MSRAQEKKEWKQRLKADASGEVQTAKQELEAMEEKLRSLELMFRTLADSTKSERTEENANDIAYSLEYAADCCATAIEDLETLGESEATTLMRFLQDKLDIEFEDRIL